MSWVGLGKIYPYPHFECDGVFFVTFSFHFIGWFLVMGTNMMWNRSLLWCFVGVVRVMSEKRDQEEWGAGLKVRFY